MKVKKVVQFRCKEKGCSGVISFESRFTVPIMTGCNSFSSACWCPECGRMHWPTGEFVLNRSFEKAFLIDGEIKLKSLCAEEKLEVVTGLVSDSKKNSEHTDYFRQRLFFLLGQGHADDCPGQVRKKSCNCGHLIIEDLLAENN